MVNQAECEDDEDCEVPRELARLLQQEERAILPHEELLETVNLGTEEDRKKVQVGANLEPSVKEHLIQLLKEHVEIFAWSYEDMPGLDRHRGSPSTYKIGLSTDQAKSPPNEARHV